MKQAETLALVGLGALALIARSKLFPIPGISASFGGPWNINIWGTSFRNAVLADGTKDNNPSIDAIVSLPSTTVLGRMVQVEYKGNFCTFPNKDTGPWYVDDAYWAKVGKRPLVEATYVNAPRPFTEAIARRLSEQRSQFRYRIPTQRGAIDLSPAAWICLGLEPARVLGGNFSGVVSWRFVD